MLKLLISIVIFSTVFGAATDDSFINLDDDTSPPEHPQMPSYDGSKVLEIPIIDNGDLLANAAIEDIPTLSGTGWWWGVDTVFNVVNTRNNRFFIRKELCNCLAFAQTKLNAKINKHNKTTTPKIRPLTIHLIEGYRTVDQQSSAYILYPSTESPILTKDKLHDIYPGRCCGATITVFPITDKYLGTYPIRLYRSIGCTTNSTDHTWKTDYKPKNILKQRLRKYFIDSMVKAGFTNLGSVDRWEMGTRYTAFINHEKYARYGIISMKE